MLLNYFEQWIHWINYLVHLEIDVLTLIQRDVPKARSLPHDSPSQTIKDPGPYPIRPQKWPGCCHMTQQAPLLPHTWLKNGMFMKIASGSKERKAQGLEVNDGLISKGKTKLKWTILENRGK